MTKTRLPSSRLAELLKIKSRTTIKRILHDETSIKALEAFAQKIEFNENIKFTSIELKRLKNALNVNRSGKDHLIARQHLLEIFDLSETCVESEFPNNTISIFPINEFLIKADILIFGRIPISVVEDLLGFIANQKEVKFTIRHIISFNDRTDENAATFKSIFKLLNFDFYIPYYYAGTKSYQNVIILKKEDGNGTQTTDITLFFGSEAVSLHDQPSDELFSLYEDLFLKISYSSKPVKRVFNKTNPTNGLITLCQWFLGMENSSSEYMLKQNMCFQMVPFDILYKIFEETGYFGLGYASSIVQELIVNFRNRCTNYFQTKKTRHHFFTKRGLSDFIDTGFLSDHYLYFRPFNLSERKAILQHFLNQIETNKHIKLNLLKNDYAIKNFEIAFFEDKCIYLLESSSGYGIDYFGVLIEAEAVNEMFEDFIKNEILENHVYSESESLDYLKYLISTMNE